MHPLISNDTIISESLNKSISSIHPTIFLYVQYLLYIYLKNIIQTKKLKL